MKPPTRWTSTFTYFCTIFLEYLEALRIWCSPSNFLHFVQVSDRRNGLSIRYSTIVVTWHRKTDLRPTKRGFDMQKEANKSIYLKRNTIWMDLWWWLVRPILKHDVCASHTSLQGWYSRLSDQRCENFLTGWPVVDLRFDSTCSTWTGDVLHLCSWSAWWSQNHPRIHIQMGWWSRKTTSCMISWLFHGFSPITYQL